jgi:hypothetical protein
VPFPRALSCGSDEIPLFAPKEFFDESRRKASPNSD